MTMMDESDTAEAGEAFSQSPEPTANDSQHNIVAKMDAVGQLDEPNDETDVRPSQHDAAGASSGSASDSPAAAAAADTSTSSGALSSTEKKRNISPVAAHNSTVDDAHHDDDDDVLHDIPVHHDSDYPDQDIDEMMGLDDAASGRRTGRQPFDLEMAGNDDDDDDDAEYGESKHDHAHQAVCCLSKYCCPCLPPCYKIGNATVIIPPLYEKTFRYGVIGPHWPGLVFTFGLLWSASYYYTNHAFTSIGPISGGICLAMTTICTVLLCAVAFGDPGMITPEGQERGAHGNGVGGKYAGLPTDGRDLSDWRYCDLCSIYQPPTAAHCPDCNLCIDGYDHHCPWMGTCIGKRNMKAFISFNLSWMFFLFYAVAWVSFGPMVASGGRGGNNAAWQGHAGNSTDGTGDHNITGNHSMFF